MITAENRKINETLDWIIHIAIAILIGILIVTFIGQRTLVHDISMQPTLVEGDNLLVEKLSPKFGGIHRGDIIVFYSHEEGKQLIKRLIAVEGDKVEIKDGKVYVNGVADATSNLSGKVVTEPRKNPKYSNLTVQKGYIYALGDNRPNSMDSRILGPIEKKYITGRAVFRFYPFNKFGKP